jgi:hypothetical protein
LPELPKFSQISGIHPDDVTRMLKQYGRKCARAARADERRKALEEVEADCRDHLLFGAAARIRALIDRKEPT